MEYAAGILFGLLLIAGVINIGRQAGYASRQIALLLVPVLNLYCLYCFAFNDWPLTERCESLEREVARLQALTGKEGR